MAITTDSTVNITSGGITYDRIGFSKTLDNYTIDEIVAFTYCAGDNTLIKHITEKQNDTLVNTLDGVDVPVHVEQYSATIMVANAGVQANENQGEKGVYCGVVWLSKQSSGLRYVITSTSISDYKIVTEFRAKDYVYDLNSPAKINCGGQIYGTTDWSGSDQTAHEVWYSTGGSLVYYSDNYGTVTIDVSSYRIDPYLVFKYNDKVYFFKLTMAINEFYSNHNNGYENPVTASSYSSYDGTTAISVSAAIEQLWNSSWSNIDWNFPEDWTKTGGGAYGWSYTGLCFNAEISQYGLVNGTNSGLYSGCSLKFYFNTRDAALDFWKCCGVKFYADKIYKPIIVDGYVTGYTDNLDTASELDTWTGASNHSIPSVRPSPTPTPGYDDDPWNGATFAGTGVGGAGAFAKCYYMTSTELANLRTWMNSINVPEGFDPMQQIIGLSQVPVALSGSGPENVVFVNSSAVYDPGVKTRAVDTGVATQQAMGTPISYYLGSVDIVRRMQQRGEPYLDYDCQIELYLPLIGMFSLDTQTVMGRTISAYAVLDPVSGTLAAYAYVTKDGQNLPVAYGSTTIGVDLPISAQQLSVSRAALKQANAQLGASLLSGALTMLAAASSSGKSSGSGAKTSPGSSGLSAAGIREAGSDYMKASQVGNVFGDFMNWGRTIRQLSYGNNTAIAGSFGGSTAQWSYPFTPYVKIIRPRYEKPSNYNHSQGVPCVQTKTIGSCTGFIQCIGADVSGISGATDLELQAIQAALSNGIYAGGGQ